MLNLVPGAAQKGRPRPITTKRTVVRNWKTGISIYVFKSNSEKKMKESLTVLLT